MTDAHIQICVTAAEVKHCMGRLEQVKELTMELLQHKNNW